MIDAETGSVSFEAPPCRIDAGMTRSAFAASKLAVRAKVAVSNEPWCSWNLHGHHVSTLTFLVTVYFHGERLSNISLCASLPDDGSSWADWSREKEMTRKDLHDGWLDRTLGHRRTFDWGKVRSSYDERAGSSSIEIEYTRRHG